MSLFVVPVLVFCSACSVKEDRSGCPCDLVLDLEAVGERVRRVDFPVRLRIEGDGFAYAGWLDEADCSGIFHVEVPARRVRVWVVAGDEGLFDGGVEIPPGLDSPPLVWWEGNVDTSGETASCRVDPWKDYCRLTLRLLGNVEGLPYTVALSGRVCGFVRPGEVLEGDFRFQPEVRLVAGEGLPVPAPAALSAPGATSSGTTTVLRECTVLLPRQRGADLRLDILPPGASAKSFALGMYIQGAGYDWEAHVLEDLTIDVDFAATDIRVVPPGWAPAVFHENVF